MYTLMHTHRHPCTRALYPLNTTDTQTDNKQRLAAEEDGSTERKTWQVNCYIHFCRPLASQWSKMHGSGFSLLFIFKMKWFTPWKHTAVSSNVSSVYKKHTFWCWTMEKCWAKENPCNNCKRWYSGSQRHIHSVKKVNTGEQPHVFL